MRQRTEQVTSGRLRPRLFVCLSTLFFLQTVIIPPVLNQSICNLERYPFASLFRHWISLLPTHDILTFTNMDMDNMLGGGGGGAIGQFPLEQWFYEMPVCTRYWTTATIATSVLVQCHVITPFQLFYSFRAVFVKNQVRAARKHCYVPL